MADIAVAVRNRLVANAPLVAKVATRIYPVNRPQDSLLPAIRYIVISDNGEEHLKGQGGPFTARIQFDAFSKSYLETREIARLLTVALPGPVVDGTIQIGRVLWDRPNDGGDDTTGGYIHRARVDLLVEYAVLA
jgi:hypothetical protein